MPKRVLFRVIQCTGSHDEYSAKNLEVQSPFIKGWRSPRFCLYPQELVLRLDPPARVRKVQLLSHQHLISSRVELFIGEFTSSKRASMDRTKFSRLGYISLSNNEDTGFRSREMKSVNLDCYGELIKFVFQRNHVNHLNLYNQVGLVALNIVADSSIVADTSTSGSDLSGHALLTNLVHNYFPGVNQASSVDLDPILQGLVNKRTNILPVDDMSFGMAQDRGTEDIIRELENRKAKAVEGENLGEAKRLKLVIEELSKAGQVLWRYELQKREAIVREDYDTARAKTEKLDSARRSIYEQLGVHGLLSGAMSKKFADLHHIQHHTHPAGMPQVLGPSLSQRSCQSVAPLVRHNTAPFLCTPSARSSTTGRAAVDVMEFGWGRTSPLPPIATNFSPPSPPPLKTSISPEMRKSSAEERPLPSLPKQSMAGRLITVSEQEEQSSDQLQGWRTNGADELGQVTTAVMEPLTEKQLAVVRTAVDVFGMDVVESLFAKQFSVRERSLLGVQSMLSSKFDEAEREEGAERMTKRDVVITVRATCQVLANGFNDKVFSIFSCCQDLLRYLVGPFAQHHNLSKQEFSLLVDKVIPVLLARTGGLPPRICAAAVCSITELIRHTQIQELVGPVLVGPYKQKNPSWRLIKGRLVLLARLIENPGLAPCGLNIRKSMTFVASYLDHNMGEVREVAADLAIKCYVMNGIEVRALMPVPDNAISRRKTLWKKLFEKFDKIDGGSSPAKIEVPRNIVVYGESGCVTVYKKPLTQTAMANSHPDASNASKHSRQLVYTERQWMQGEEAGDGRSSSCNSNGGVGGGKEKMMLVENPREEMDLLDKMCVFCGKEPEDLLSDTAMEFHYLEECPMLQSCFHCQQVVEIAALTNHWLTECKGKDQFQECLICKEAVLKKEFSRHAEVGGCVERQKEQDEKLPCATTTDQPNRCPLCHSFIPLGDEGWRGHLMGHRGSTNTCSGKRMPASKKSSIQDNLASSTPLVQ